jgi:hypothetical protein
MTLAVWRTEAIRRFGDNPLYWRFVCPSCGHVATVRDWKDAKAPESAVAFSCVGRWLPGPVATIFEKPGPCNYAGGGLFPLNPQEVTDDKGKSYHFFAFADEPGEEVADA